MSHPRNSPQADPPLIELIEAVLNGQADEALFGQLEQCLQDDAAARDTYTTYVNLHCELGERFAVEGDIVLLEAELAKELHDEGEIAGFRQKTAAESMQRRHRHSLPRRVLALATLAALVLVSVPAWNYFNPASYNSQATVRDLSGKVTIGNSSATTQARIGDVLRSGDRLQTDNRDARAVLEYADGTTVEVHVNSAVQVPADGDVRLRLLTGSIDVDAAPQLAGRPLILATDHARYVVVGTRFRIYRNEAATRLELNKGQVLLQRQNDGQVVETVIEAGSVAVAFANRISVEVFPLAAGKARLHATLTATGEDATVSSSGELLIVNGAWHGRTAYRTQDFSLLDENRLDPGASSGLAIAPDGRTAVFVKQYGGLQLWRPGGELRTLPFSAQNVRSRALSPDGLVAAMSSEAGIEVFSISVDEGRLTPVAVLPNFNGRSGKAWSMAISSHGRRLAAGFWDGTTRVYDLNARGGADSSPNLVLELKLQDTPSHVALSDDGHRLAVFAIKDGLRLIDIATGQQDALWSSAEAGVFRLKFTPDSRYLIAGCGDRTIRLWSAADRRPLLVIDAKSPSGGFAWIAQRRLLAVTTDRGVSVWECELP